MAVTTWALLVLLIFSAGLIVLTLVGEYFRNAEPAPPVRISIHSLDDAQQPTARLTPPPDLKFGGVTGRPRAVFLGEDGEWIANPHK